MVQKGHEVAEDEGVVVRLQGLSGLEVDLNEEYHETLSLQSQCRPPIALMKKFSRVVREVFGGVQSQEASCVPSLASRVSSLAIGLPASVGVVLQGPGGGSFSHVSLMQEEKGIFLDLRFDVLSMGVRHKFISWFFD